MKESCSRLCSPFIMKSSSRLHKQKTESNIWGVCSMESWFLLMSWLTKVNGDLDKLVNSLLKPEHKVNFLNQYLFLGRNLSSPDCTPYKDMSYSVESYKYKYSGYLSPTVLFNKHAFIFMFIE